MSWSARVKFIWQERASEFEPLSLPQRYHHTSVLYKDPNLLDIKLIICGGHARNGSFFSDVWVFSKAQKSWFQFKPETPLFLEKTASVVVNNFLYLLGGVNESKEYVSLNTIPVLDCQQIEKGWEKVVAKGSCPNSCVGHTASLVNKRIYVMGGTDTETFETLWALDTVRLEWQQIKSRGSTPKSRHSHEIVQVEQLLFVFGGFDKTNNALTDFWCFDTQMCEWRELSRPSLQSCQTYQLNGPFTIDKTRCLLLLPTKRFNNQIHVYNIEENKWYTCECDGDVPSIRVLFTMPLAEENRIVIFGTSDLLEEDNVITECFCLFWTACCLPPSTSEAKCETLSSKGSLLQQNKSTATIPSFKNPTEMKTAQDHQSEQSKIHNELQQTVRQSLGDSEHKFLHVQRRLEEDNRKIWTELVELKEIVKEQQKTFVDLSNRIVTLLESLHRRMESLPIHEQLPSSSSSLSSSNSTPPASNHSTSQQDVQYLQYMLKQSEEDKKKLQEQKEELQRCNIDLIEKYNHIKSRYEKTESYTKLERKRPHSWSDITPIISKNSDKRQVKYDEILTGKKKHTNINVKSPSYKRSSKHHSNDSNDNDDPKDNNKHNNNNNNKDEDTPNNVL